MAVQAKTYLDYTGLQRYDTNIKTWANSINQLGIKTVLKSTDGNSLNFYAKPNATLSDTATFSIELGSADLQDQLDALADVVGVTYDSSTGEYSADFSGAGLSSTDLVSAIVEVFTDINDFVGEIPSGATATTVIGYIAEAITDALAALDGTATIASKSGDVVTIKTGITQTAGEIANDSGTDIVLEEVASTGAAEDVSIADSGSYFTSENVEDALQELAQASQGGVASKTVYITETAGSSSDPFSKRYGIYQGATGSSASPVVGEKLADIDIPKDMVVESGSIVDITYNTTDGKLYDGATDVTELIKGAGGTATAADAGKYIKLVIANATSDVLYIAAQSLVDIYTVEANASEVQLAISNANEISATIVNIDGTKIGYTYSSGTMTESVAAALTRLDGDDSTTGSVAKKIKDAVEALDTSSDVSVASYTAGTSGAADVITLTGSVAESDGIIEAGSADTITLSTITEAQINALFS